jgi:hypothetical protein
VTEEQSNPSDNPVEPSRPVEAGPSVGESDPAQAPATAGAAGVHKGLHHPDRPPLFAPKTILWVTFFLVLTAATRCANYRDIIVPDQTGAGRQIFYANGEGDCYSRMTRVREVLSGWGIIHYHAWENYPQGIWPHTTAPMDYLIAGLALLLKPFMTDYIDMAGAIVSPLLGVLTTAFLALWARELNQRYRRLMLLVVAVSPILVHGTELGRPRHQSLQIFLLAVGIGAELIMARRPRVSWSIVSGIAWGLALWVSLYEPLIMLAAIYVTKLVFYRPKLFVKERLWGLGIFVGILATAYALEGSYLFKSFAIETHDPALRNYFGNWSATIGEMMGGQTVGMNIFSALLFRGVGFGLLVAPLLLIARLRDAKRSILLLALLIITFALTMTELRWEYFFALIFAMSLPWQLSLFKWKWLVWPLFLLSLWPLAREWDERLFDESRDLHQAADLSEQWRLRWAAEFIKEKAPGAILAPWWWSPQLVYWSGQPAMAGSSHESLAGIVDTARFFTATNPLVAKRLCDEHYVETVVIGDPGRIVDQSCKILGLPPLDKPMAEVLWTKPHSAPIFLHIVFDNNVVKVFEVNHGYIVR